MDSRLWASSQALEMSDFGFKTREDDIQLPPNLSPVEPAGESPTISLVFGQSDHTRSII